MRRIFLVCLLLGVVAGCGPGIKPPPGGVVIEFGKHPLRAEVAATPQIRERGLMGRRSLETDSGMIFLFPPDKPTGAFWMKDTLIPLSIAFMVRTGADRYRVIAVMDMQPCRADPCRLYYPGSRYDAAVEAPVGWYQRLGISSGTVAKVVGSAPTAS